MILMTITLRGFGGDFDFDNHRIDNAEEIKTDADLPTDV